MLQYRALDLQREAISYPPISETIPCTRTNRREIKFRREAKKALLRHVLDLQWEAFSDQSRREAMYSTLPTKWKNRLGAR